MATIKCKTCHVKYKNVNGKEDITCNRQDCPMKEFAVNSNQEISFVSWEQDKFDTIEEWGIPESSSTEIVDITDYQWFNNGSKSMDREPGSDDESTNNIYGG